MKNTKIGSKPVFGFTYNVCSSSTLHNNQGHIPRIRKMIRESNKYQDRMNLASFGTSYNVYYVHHIYTVVPYLTTRGPYVFL